MIQNCEFSHIYSNSDEESNRIKFWLDFVLRFIDDWIYHLFFLHRLLVVLNQIDQSKKNPVRKITNRRKKKEDQNNYIIKQRRFEHDTTPNKRNYKLKLSLILINLYLFLLDEGPS